MYKEYESALLEKVRKQVESRCHRRFIPVDPDADLDRIAFSRPVKHADCNAYFLELNGELAGYTEGAMGEDTDSAYAYQLIALPGADINYEFISYRYNRDKFFLFRNSRLIGYLEGSFSTSLDEITSWQFMVNENKRGAINVNDAMLREKRLALQFVDKREPIFFRTESPPLYMDFFSALSYFFNRYVALSRPPSNDFVFCEVPESASAAEMELIFCAFVFFRSLVFA